MKMDKFIMINVREIQIKNARYRGSGMCVDRRTELGFCLTVLYRKENHGQKNIRERMKRL